MPNISEYPRAILTYFTGLLGVLVGIIFQVFVWQSPKGRCYGNQLNMGDVHKRHVGSPSLFASAFDNGMADCKPLSMGSIAIISVHYVQIWCTLCPNLVNFCQVISEFTLLKRAFFAAMHPQF